MTQFTNFFEFTELYTYNQNKMELNLWAMTIPNTVGATAVMVKHTWAQLREGFLAICLSSSTKGSMSSMHDAQQIKKRVNNNFFITIWEKITRTIVCVILHVFNLSLSCLLWNILQYIVLLRNLSKWLKMVQIECRLAQ